MAKPTKNSKRYRLAYLGIVLASSACVSSYRDGLGYRAREAALAQDAAAFEPLMAEAAEARLMGRIGDLKRTVLTHFLELGGHPRYFEILEHWRQKGWIDDTSQCAIQRGRYRGTTDSEAAQIAIQTILERARQAAWSGERLWEIDACLEEAPFLTASSTVAITPFLRIAVDEAEPRPLRAALLSSMTHLYLQEPARRRINDATISVADAIAQSEAQYAQLSARMTLILDTAQAAGTDPGLLAGATAFGALELERAAQALGRSFVQASPPELAWAWVRGLKTRAPVDRLVSLGLWDRKVEPLTEATWWACARRVDDAVQLKLLRSVGFEPPPWDPWCSDDPERSGPYPLASTARVVAAQGARVLGVERKIVPPAVAPTSSLRY